MLYASLYVPHGQAPFAKDILREPAISMYVQGWGREDDRGFLAVTSSGSPVGSITARYFDEVHRGYGFVSADIPEISMAVQASYRRKGIGTNLLQTLLDALRKQGVHGVSLSVDPRNEAAVALYKCFGFYEVGKEGTSITMIADL